MKLINGPVSVMRLTNNDKIIYIFADIHIPQTKTSECHTIKKDNIIFKRQKIG